MKKFKYESPQEINFSFILTEKQVDHIVSQGDQGSHVERITALVLEHQAKDLFTAVNFENTMRWLFWLEGEVTKQGCKMADNLDAGQMKVFKMVSYIVWAAAWEFSQSPDLYEV